MHSSSGDSDFDGPYAIWADARPLARVATAVFGGGLWSFRIGCGGYVMGFPGGKDKRSVCSAVTSVERPPNEEEMVLNSTCLRDGSAEPGGRWVI